MSWCVQHGGVWGVVLSPGCDGQRSSPMSRQCSTSQEPIRRRLHHDRAHARWRHRTRRRRHQTVHNATSAQRKTQGWWIFITHADLVARAIIRSVRVCVCVSAVLNENHWTYHHQTWQVDSTWQVLFTHFIWGQKIKCQDRRESALFWVPVQNVLEVTRISAVWLCTAFVASDSDNAVNVSLPNHRCLCSHVVPVYPIPALKHGNLTQQSSTSIVRIWWPNPITLAQGLSYGDLSLTSAHSGVQT